VERFRDSDLLHFCGTVITALGAPPATANAVADSLVKADVRGVGTHGVVRLPSYRRQVEAGEVDVEAQPRVVHGHGATALVDGERAFGALTANFAIDLAIERAARNGVGVVAARRCMHFGAAAHYALRAARAGLIGVAATNTPAVMAPFGGAEAALGNNPFAVAAPMPEGREPFVLDMAQSVVSRGRVKLAEMSGDPIPEGWALDPAGEPTTDPALALAGTLLPFGAYKGYGIALTVEVLTAVLAGAGLSPELTNTSMTGEPLAREGAAPGSVGNLFLVIDPEAFAGRAVFEDGLARLADAMVATRPAPGADAVLFPGQLEERAAADARARGVPLAPTTIDLLAELAAELGLPDPVAL
jgi:LDH2 family malate/lactate/ureidoglycolate dehydrogenase